MSKFARYSISSNSSVQRVVQQSNGSRSSNGDGLLRPNFLSTIISSFRSSLFTSQSLHEEIEEGEEQGEGKVRKLVERYKGTERDRRQPIPLETSIRYLRSNAFKECYGDEPVWKNYRRNFKGQYPRRTRKTCIRGFIVSTGNPCPICRDEYLVVHHQNIELLKHFVSPTTGELLHYSITNVCQHQYQKLLAAYLRAKDIGLLTFHVPFREYDYNDYLQYLERK